MQKSLVSLLIVAAFPALATANTTGSPGPKICGQPSASGLVTMGQSVDAASELGARALASGLTTLEHFPAVQALIKGGDVARVCGSGIVLDRNIYKNNLDLLVIEIEKKSGEKLVLPTLLQTASIQAYEGPGGQRPWIGFSREDLATTVRSTIAQSTLTEVALNGEVDPIALAKPLFSNSNVELETRSYVFIPDVDPSATTYLVSQLRFLGDSTSYASHVLLDTVVVQISGTTARVGVLNGFFAGYHDLLVRQNLSQPSSKDLTEQVSQLERLSK